MKGYCNICGKFIEDLNELEKEELIKEKSFVCSDCINEDMEKWKNKMRGIAKQNN